MEKKYRFLEDDEIPKRGDWVGFSGDYGLTYEWEKIKGKDFGLIAGYHRGTACPLGTKIEFRREIVELEEKPRHELVPPECHDALAIGMTWGAKQNPDRKGEEHLRELDDEKILAKVMRHVVSHRSGTYSDSLSTLPHLLHAYVNLGLLVAKYLRHPECRFEYDAKFGACGDHGRNEL